MSDEILTIRPNQLYSDSLSQEQIYDLARGIWKIRPEKYKHIKYAFIIFKGVIKEIFEIEAWHHANTTKYKHPRPAKFDPKGRWEFTGTVAAKKFRDQYLGRRLEFIQGMANPAMKRSLKEIF